MVTLVVTMEEELLRMIEASGCFGESQRETDADEDEMLRKAIAMSLEEQPRVIEEEEEE